MGIKGNIQFIKFYIVILNIFKNVELSMQKCLCMILKMLLALIITNDKCSVVEQQPQCNEKKKK